MGGGGILLWWIKFSVLPFSLYSVDKYICPQYELVNILMIEILKVVEKCKIYQNKRSREACGWPFDKKIAQVAGICQTLEICLRGGGGNPWN